jgi:hypothetical protein
VSRSSSKLHNEISLATEATEMMRMEDRRSKIAFAIRRMAIIIGQKWSAANPLYLRGSSAV